MNHFLYSYPSFMLELLASVEFGNGGKKLGNSSSYYLDRLMPLFNGTCYCHYMILCLLFLHFAFYSQVLGLIEVYLICNNILKYRARHFITVQVKEVIICFFVLMEQGKATRQACVRIGSSLLYFNRFPNNCWIYGVDSWLYYWYNFLMMWNRISICGVRN